MSEVKVLKEIREKVLNKIKHEGLSVLEASKNYGLTKYRIYKWLGAKTDGPSYAEVAKLRRENKTLKEMIGEMTVKLSESQKKN
jgi:transposase